jgi:two-component system KDP operon response regulator KdpE
MYPEPFQVLIVADDPALRQSLRSRLATTGFALKEAGSREAAELVSNGHYDLVLLDLNSDGLGTCRSLRAQSASLGIVMVRTGGTPGDEVRALEAGADDCVAAPFRFREIVARLGAILRRRRPVNRSRTAVLRAGDLEIDVTRRLFWRAGKKIHLSPKEFDLLVFLVKNQGVPLTHLKLLRAVWGPDSASNPLYLRTYIKALRKKIEKDPANPQYLLTEPWVGYRFCNPEVPE